MSHVSPIITLWSISDSGSTSLGLKDHNLWLFYQGKEVTLFYIMSLHATVSRMIQVLAVVVLSMHVTPLNPSIIMYICSHHLDEIIHLSTVLLQTIA
jgi:hypothetical protein